MTKYLTALCLVFTFLFQANAQENTTKWAAALTLGQYPASIITPSFSPLHLGGTVGLDYQWNNSEKHQLKQAGRLGYFFHNNLQHAVQLYTELGYHLKFNNGWSFNPLSLGGGYVMSISDMTTLDWDATTQTYTEVDFPVRNNWLLSLGASVGYETPWKIKEQPMTFFLAYRIQIQGVIVQNTVPVIAYAPVMIGVSLPVNFGK